MHAPHIKKKDFNLTLNSFFEISKSAILLKKKKTIFKKIFRFVFNENTDRLYDQKNTDLYLMKIQTSFVTKKSDLYLMKIQISFETRKNSYL